MKTTTSIRVNEELIEICDKVAQELNISRSNLLSIIIERVATQMLSEIEKKKKNK